MAPITTARIASPSSIGRQSVCRTLAPASLALVLLRTDGIATVPAARVVPASSCPGHPVRRALSPSPGPLDSEESKRDAASVRENICERQQTLGGGSEGTMLACFLFRESHWLSGLSLIHI